MTVKIVPIRWGVAHVCHACGCHGPIAAEFDKEPDASEAHVPKCDGTGDSCLAALAGWHVGGIDLCPKCRKNAPEI